MTEDVLIRDKRPLRLNKEQLGQSICPSFTLVYRSFVSKVSGDERMTSK
jgi:hypothetical protein